MLRQESLSTPGLAAVSSSTGTSPEERTTRRTSSAISSLVVSFSGRSGTGKVTAHLIGGETLRRRGRQATGDDLSAAGALTRAEEDAELAVIPEDVADYLAMAIIAIAALLDPKVVIVATSPYCLNTRIRCSTLRQGLQRGPALLADPGVSCWDFLPARCFP